MSSDPDSNNRISKAFIRERYITGKLPSGSYVKRHISPEEIKQKYGLKQYIQISKTVTDIIGAW